MRKKFFYKQTTHQDHPPETRLLRLSQVLEIIPVSKSTWWLMIRSGEAPKPIKLSKRCSAWRTGDIQAIVAGTYQSDHKAKRNEKLRTHQH